LYEKGVPFEEEKIDLATGAHKSPEYKKLQPFGVVPVLDDDGFILYGNKPNPFLLLNDKESRAIVKYLEQKYKGKGTELVPTDLKAYGLAEQGAYLESQCFDSPSSIMLGQLYFRK
jgi:glutathione S-transferase